MTFDFRQESDRVVYDTGSLGRVVTIANLCVTAIGVTALIMAGGSVPWVIAGSMGYFYGSTLGALAFLSGTVNNVITNHQNNKTQIRIMEIQRGQLPDPGPVPALAVGPAEGLQTPAPLPGNFVPAEDRDLARSAVLWAADLYGSDGRANPDRVWVNAGFRLRGKAPGRADVKEYLIRQKVLKPVTGGYALNVARFPDLSSLQGLLTPY